MTGSWVFAVEHPRVFDARNLRLAGRTLSVADPSSPASKFFVVEDTEDLAQALRALGVFDEDFTRSLMRMRDEFNLVIGLATEAETGSIAFVARAGCDLAVAITGATDRPVLVITPKTSRAVLAHEEQHLRDYREDLPQKLIHQLDSARFKPATDQAVLTFLLELRAYTVESEHIAHHDQSQLLSAFDQRYLEPALSVLHHKSKDQQLTLQQMVRDLTTDMPPNLIRRWVSVKFGIDCASALLPATGSN